MRIRPLATAAAAALVLGVGGPAVAATSAATVAQPAAGSATSGLTLLSLALAGHDIRVGSVALTSSTLSGSPTSKVVVTPVRANGTAYGEQTVTPASSPASVPSFDSAAALPAALGTVASVKSPVFNVTSSSSPAAASKAGAASLGSVSILGLPVALNGTVDVSSVVDGTNALGNKTVSVKNLALPSIADLLAALGLDLSKLPTKTLTDLLAGLNLTDTVVTAAQKALTDAQAALGTAFTDAQAAVDAQQVTVNNLKSQVLTQTAALTAAKADLAAAQPVLSQAKTAATEANVAMTQAQATYDAAVSPVQIAATLLGMTVDQYAAANSGLAIVQTFTAAKAALTSAQAVSAAAAADLADAQSIADAANAAVAAAQAAVDATQALLDSAVALLNTLLNTLNNLLGQLGPQINALLAAVTAVLDGTPLVSIDSFTVETQAMVTSATAGGQVAKVTGGEIQGVHVLGTDVLQNVLGNTKIDVLALTGSTLSQVTSELSALTGVLSSVLSAVPGLTVPAPTVGLLTKSTSTSIANGFGTAQNSVQALSISIPAITLPAALALPSAASLPAITGVPNLAGALGIAAVGDLVSQPMTISVGTLSENATFRPATVAAPGSAPGSTPPAAGPPLATTGLPAGVAVLAFLLVGFGLVIRRRLAAEV
ncbi:MAG: hypothetical protein JJD92_13170 [Frankiaceae bacterium]|nr:hypothetical protein [Frankiaceae bacterium]